MRRLLISWWLLLPVGLAAQTGRGELLEISAVRCWTLSEATRVVVEISGEFQYHSERAQSPERVFFDIQHARPHIAGRRYYSVQVDDKVVKRVRVAETSPGVTRIVLDLANGAEYKATQLSNPDRLVIELRPPAVVASATPPPSEPVAAPNTPVAPEKAAASPPRSADTGRAATLTGGPASLTRALGLKIRRVVIDPGHGGHDEGTVGPGGLMEKELVLDVALRLGKLIETRMGSEVIYTRTDDTFIPLQDRTAMANDKKADLFLSIHANSSAYPDVGGVETYFLNLTDSKDALAVAARENASSDKSVFELRDLIQKITLQDKVEESKDFAGRVQASLFAFAARYNSGIKNRGVKKAPFVVLIGASMPSVLAEIGFLSNPREEALLNKPQHRQKLAEALYRGVSRYAQSLSHYQIALNN
jgi:N-acetylmuramoyl-L-alanine amidase